MVSWLWTTSKPSRFSSSLNLALPNRLSCVYMRLYVYLPTRNIVNSKQSTSGALRSREQMFIKITGIYLCLVYFRECIRLINGRFAAEVMRKTIDLWVNRTKKNRDTKWKRREEMMERKRIRCPRVYYFPLNFSIHNCLHIASASKFNWFSSRILNCTWFAWMCHILVNILCGYFWLAANSISKSDHEIRVKTKQPLFSSLTYLDRISIAFWCYQTVFGWYGSGRLFALWIFFLSRNTSFN